MKLNISAGENRALILVWAGIVIYIIYFFSGCVFKYYSFSYNDFDLAIHSQVLWNLLRGVLYNSVLGINFLGNHAHFVSFLIAPVYKILPHPLTLLFLQAFALGLGAWPLYLLAKSVLNYRWALAVSFIYLFYPALGYVNLFEYHPTVFATLFLFFTLYYFYKERFVFFSVFMILSMLCQENIPLAIIALGFYALIKRRKFKWVILPILLGGLYFVFCIFWLMPYFNKNTIQFITIYGHLGRSYPEILINIFRHPIAVTKFMFMKEKILYLINIFGPLSFVSFVSPLSLIPALPLLMQHLLSLRGTETSIYYHYAAEMIPFIFFSFIFGIKNLLSQDSLRRRQFFLMLCFCLIALGFNIRIGPHFILWRKFNTAFKQDALDKERIVLLKNIPNEASVVATFEFLPQLAHRKWLYSFHHVYMGYHTLSRQLYKLPEDTKYALINFNDQLTFTSFYALDNYKNLLDFFGKKEWGVIAVKDAIVLFKKNTPDKYYLYSLISGTASPKTYATSLVADEIKLLGVDLEGIEENVLTMSLYWQSIKVTDKDINIFLDFIDEAGRIVYRTSRPICYRIYPTQAWHPGEVIKEKIYLLLPSRLTPGRYLIKMGFFNFVTGELCENKSEDPLKRIDITQIDIIG
ncbi:MAG: hypothetical protein DRP74_07140 [Candidatus Omnitrophota bacterium]|nr:MAG: hypothetical protein DRP74_07140 [Candidatus Omnitrophota bacterium]